MLSTTDPRLSKVKSATPSDVSLPSSSLPPIDGAPFDISLRQALLRSTKSARARTTASRPMEPKPEPSADSGLVNRRRPTTSRPEPRHDATLKKAHPRHAPLQAQRAGAKAAPSESLAEDPDLGRVAPRPESPVPEGVKPVGRAALAPDEADPAPATPLDAAGSEAEVLATVVIPLPLPFPRLDLPSATGATEETEEGPTEGHAGSAVIVPLFANPPLALSRGPVSGEDLAGQPSSATDDRRIIPIPVIQAGLREGEVEPDVPVTSEIKSSDAAWPAGDVAMVPTETEHRDLGPELNALSWPGLPDASEDRLGLTGDAPEGSEVEPALDAPRELASFVENDVASGLEMEPVRPGAVSAQPPQPERGAGDLRIDNVIQLFSVAENGRDAARSTDGTGGAKSSLLMKNAEGTSRASKGGEQTLPAGDPKRSSTADNAPPSARSGNGADATSPDRLSVAMGVSAVNRSERGHAEVSAAPVEVRPPTNLEQIQQKLVNCAVELKRFKADSMSVVLKPDAHTEVYLHLTLNQGWVDVETQLKRGDLASLQGQWGHMQEALSRQGVRVGPLQGADAQSFANLDGGGSSSGSGREQHPSGEPQAGPSGQPIFVSTQPASRPQTGRLNRPDDRSWESWA